MARTDNDTWDPATSVGTTATLVATARALATRAGLINDPFAEPLVRAVGLDFFTKVASGELALSDLGDNNGLALLTDLLAVRTRFFDNFLTDACRAGIRQAVILASGLDARPYRLWWPAGDHRVRNRPTPGDRLQNPDAAWLGRDAERPTDARWASTFGRTGRRRCGGSASTPPNRLCGLRRDCSSGFCSRSRRTGCLTTSPR